ncbi:MAG: 2-hydroxyacid dehydrogenase [Thermoguttaceae bacterium]
MKLLAISDHYIQRSFMQDGLQPLSEQGVEVEVRPWEHETLEELQEANLAIEQGGPDAVSLPEELFVGLDQYDFLVVQFAPIPRRMIEEATRLKYIGVLRSGVENVDVQTATQRGIKVLNTPGRNARAVAECTLGLILTEIRNLARSHAALKQGMWTRDFPNKAEIPELLDRTVGLIGFGAIARLVARFLTGFGAKIIAYDPFVQGETGSVEMVDLPTLLKRSDIISMHARYSKETHHLLGPKELAMLKPNVVIVNTARSGLIDEEALIEVLQNQSIMGAALDVFDEEPLPIGHPFFSLENVTITPHLAGSTVDAFRNSPKLMCSHLQRLLQGETNLPIVNQ